MECLMECLPAVSLDCGTMGVGWPQIDRGSEPSGAASVEGGNQGEHRGEGEDASGLSTGGA
ncbi:hypothetical protein AMK31_08000 [Streptomyces sp. TSRI0107]|nr:hypothetical protein AMK31_08000 [Streptomyces sp. TSRI0107]